MAESMSERQVKALIANPKGRTTRVAPCLYLQSVRSKRTDRLSQSWLFRYRMDRQHHWLGLGPVDVIAYKDALATSLQYREMMVKGIDPADVRAERRAERRASVGPTASASSPTFRECAERFIASHEKGWRNAKHASQWPSTLRTYAYPIIGDLPVSIVTLDHVRRIVEPIWASKNETASRVLQRIKKVLDWATVHGYREGDNPAGKDKMSLVLPPRSKVHRVKHHDALPPAKVPALVAELRTRDSASARALMWTIFTGCRTGETTGATWGEVDEAARAWHLPLERTKTSVARTVPLSSAALDVLAGCDRKQRYLFPGGRPGRPLSDMAQLQLLRGMREGVTVHGFRQSLKNWSAQNGWADEVSERVIGHTDRNVVRGAYLTDPLLDQQRALLEAWSAYCLGG